MGDTMLNDLGHSSIQLIQRGLTNILDRQHMKDGCFQLEDLKLWYAAREVHIKLSSLQNENVCSFCQLHF